MLIINATDEQVKQMFLNAINASSPMGMGFLHFEDKDYTLEDIETADEYGADYFHGRMMKTCFTKIKGGSADGKWVVNRGPNPPNPEYQGWATKYPTYEELAATVEATVKEQELKMKK